MTSITEERHRCCEENAQKSKKA